MLTTWCGQLGVFYSWLASFVQGVMGNLCAKPPKARPPTPPATVVVKQAKLVEKDARCEPAEDATIDDNPIATMKQPAELFDAEALNIVVRVSCI